MFSVLSESAVLAKCVLTECAVPAEHAVLKEYAEYAVLAEYAEYAVCVRIMCSASGVYCMLCWKNMRRAVVEDAVFEESAVFAYCAAK
jgi:hypothetical protein